MSTGKLTASTRRAGGSAVAASRSGSERRGVGFVKDDEAGRGRRKTVSLSTGTRGLDDENFCRFLKANFSKKPAGSSLSWPRRFGLSHGNSNAQSNSFDRNVTFSRSLGCPIVRFEIGRRGSEGRRSRAARCRPGCDGDEMSPLVSLPSSPALPFSSFLSQEARLRLQQATLPGPKVSRFRGFVSKFRITILSDALHLSSPVFDLDLFFSHGLVLFLLFADGKRHARN